MEKNAFNKVQFKEGEITLTGTSSELSSLYLCTVATERRHLAGLGIIIHIEVDPANWFSAHETFCF